MNGKKIIKPFDLEASKKGAKVETRSGKKVEIFKWDANSQFPLKGIYENCEGYECAGSWNLDGEWGSAPSLDLVIVEYEGEEAPGHRETDCPKQEPKQQLWDEYTIELTDCDNGIFLKVHDFNPDANDAFLVFKREEQEQMFGKFLMDSIRAKMNCDLCSKARIDIKITTIKDKDSLLF